MKIDEKYVKGTKKAGEYREIFVNPTKQEVVDIENFDGVKWGNNVRFIALKENKKVYTSTGDVLHWMIKDVADLSNSDVAGSFRGMGVADFGEITVTKFGSNISDKEKRMMANDLINGEYNWMEKYNFDLSKIKQKAKNVINEQKVRKVIKKEVKQILNGEI